MSFRSALLLLASCCTAPFAATAQEPRMVELSYEISYAGLPGFRMDVKARLDGQAYDIESHTFKEGLIKALTIHYDGRNRAWGRIERDGAKPLGGSLALAIGDKVRTWLVQYGFDGSFQETHQPEWKPVPEHQISAEQRRGGLDPLTAAMLPAFLAGGACDRTIPSYDGKRRIDVILKKVGTDTAAATGAPGARGEAIVCELHTQRVAGEFYDAPKEAETEKQRPMKIWLVRLDDSPVLYPVKLEARTSFGVVHGKTLSVNQRPLNEQERAAMRR